MNLDLLYKLLKTPSPSGHELAIQKVVIEEMKPYADDFYKQQNMNLITAINTDSPVKVLLSGHIDEISLLIDRVNNDGTCRVLRNGGTRPYAYTCQHVYVLTKNGPVPGVFGYLPDMDKNAPKTEDLILDLGTSSKEETLELVEVGDPIIHQYEYEHLYKDMFAARALDDRLGAYICLEAMKKAKEKGTKNGVYVSTTVGEETTGRGAMSAANFVNPTCAIIVDVTYANDIRYLEYHSGEVALGKGPTLTWGSLMNQKMHEKMLEISKKLGFNVQYDVCPSRTFTDTDNIFSRFDGVPCYLVNIPLRYMHSSVEVCNLKDVEEIIDLIAEFIVELDENFNFNPFL